jgi:DNA invertase Pin-like site-specific DNA recombinase
MNCLIYARVSTDKQADKELSIPAQLQAMRQYAAQRGWQVLEEFIDAGVSGRTTARPMLHRLLARCRNPHDQIEVVLVHKIDRLARNVADHAMIRVMLKQRGIRLASVVENLDDSVSGQLVEHMMAAVAEFHSSNLSEETKKGMRQKVLQGGWPHLPPRGYRIEREGVTSRVVIDPVEGPLLAEAFELYASGWFSVKRLCGHLAKSGLRSRHGGPLAPSHLTRLLANPFYIARVHWKDLQVPAQHPALVPVELFEQVQAVLRRRHRQLRPGEGLAGFPLRSVARCAECGGRITVDRRPRWNYYRCSRQAYRRDLCSARFCRAERAHDSLERVCQTIACDAGLTLWDVYTSVRDPERVYFLSQVFESIVMSAAGITDFTLKPFWIRAVLDRQRLLQAA